MKLGNGSKRAVRTFLAPLLIVGVSAAGVLLTAGVASAATTTVSLEVCAVTCGTAITSPDTANVYGNTEFYYSSTIDNVVTGTFEILDNNVAIYSKAITAKTHGTNNATEAGNFVPTSLGTNTIVAEDVPTSGTTVASTSFVFDTVTSPLILDEVRPWGPSGATDTYAVGYNRSSSSLSLDASSHPWNIVTESGTFECSATASDCSGESLPADSYWLIEGSDFSLTGFPYYDAPISPWTTDGEATPSGEAYYQLQYEYTSTDIFVADNIGTPNAPTQYKGTLPELTNPGTTTAQWAWTRFFSGNAPVDTGNNSSDFALVSNTTATIGNQGLQPMIGSPAPNQGGPDLSPHPAVPATLTAGLFDTSAKANAAPNFYYTSGSPGTLEINRTITNHGADYACHVDLRVTSMSEANGGPEPGAKTQPAKVIHLEINEPTAASQTINSVTVYNMAPDYPDTTGGGQNSTLGEYPSTTGTANGFTIPPGGTLSVSFSFSTLTSSGSYWIGFSVLSVPGSTSSCSGVG